MTDGHGFGGAAIQFKITTYKSNQIPRSFMVIAEQREDSEVSWRCRE